MKLRFGTSRSRYALLPRSTAAATIVLGLALAQPAFAADKSAADKAAAGQVAPDPAPVIHVDQLDPEADMKAFESPKYKVHDRTKRHGEIPSTKTRDAAFKSAGISEDIKGWDAVDLDVLYLRAKRMSTNDLKARYPKLSAESLDKLRSAASGQ